MLKIGAIDGVSLTFDDSGSLTSISIPRHGKALPVSETLPAVVTRSDRPGPIFPREEFPQAKAFALEGHGRQVLQQMPEGRRTWEIYQSRADAREASLAWARATYRLDAPAEWRLSVNDCVASVQQSDGQITIQCAAHLALRLTCPAGARYETSTAKGEITGVTVTMPLPAGETPVEIVVESRPQYDVADTLILCMPQPTRRSLRGGHLCPRQARQPGQVRAGHRGHEPAHGPRRVPRGHRGPADHGPGVPEGAGRHHEPGQPRCATAASSGLILPGGGAARSEERAKALLMRQQELQKKLADGQGKVLAFAAWQRRWERVLRLINTFKPAQVVLLYPVPPDLAAAVSPGAVRLFYFWEEFRAQVGEWEKALAAKLGDRPPELVYFSDLEMLSKLAWERLSGRKFEGAFTIPDDPRYYPLGVRRALQTGQAAAAQGPRRRQGEPGGGHRAGQSGGHPPRPSSWRRTAAWPAWPRPCTPTC